GPTDGLAVGHRFREGLGHAVVGSDDEQTIVDAIGHELCAIYRDLEVLVANRRSNGFSGSPFTRHPKDVPLTLGPRSSQDEHVLVSRHESRVPVVREPWIGDGAWGSCAGGHEHARRSITGKQNRPALIMRKPDGEAIAELQRRAARALH